MDAQEREWLRREIDRVKRRRVVEAEIEKRLYRIEHHVGDREKVERQLASLHAQAEALCPGPSPDGRCLAILNVGKKWTRVLQVRCSRRATMGRFCRTHERRRVGELRVAA